MAKLSIDNINTVGEGTVYDIDMDYATNYDVPTRNFDGAHEIQRQMKLIKGYKSTRGNKNREINNG
jgi:hypothetical protein